MPHKFDPAHMERLEGADREAFLPTRAIVEALGVRPGDTVVDLGCGPGHFALAIARAVGHAGKVYGCDIQPAMLERLRQRAEQEHLSNVEAVLSAESSVPLPSAIAAAVLLANVLHEVEDPQAFLGEVQRLLRPEGSVLVVEWQPKPTPFGPPLEDRWAPARVDAQLQQAGFEPDGPLHEPGPYHYMRRYRSPGR